MNGLSHMKDIGQIAQDDNIVAEQASFGNATYLEEQAERFNIRSQRGPQRRNEVFSLPLQALRAISALLLLSAVLTLGVVVYQVAKDNKDSIIAVLPGLQNRHLSNPQELINSVGNIFNVRNRDRGRLHKKVRYYL